MKTLYFDDSLSISNDTVCCIGFFDSVHLGHLELIDRTVELSEKTGMDACLITFDKDPAEILGGKRVKQINSFEKRLSLFEKQGISTVIVIPFTEKTACMNHVDFIDLLVKRINVRTLICGFDFRFGYLGEGSSAYLQKRTEFKTIIVDEYQIANEKVSTTRIKKLLSSGDIKNVNILLGREYSLIVNSNGTIANQDLLVIPSDGNYKVRIGNSEAVVTVESGKLILPNEFKLNDSLNEVFFL